MPNIRHGSPVLHPLLCLGRRLASGGGRFAIEYLSTLTGGRYRLLQATGGPSNRLNFNAPMDTFDVLGGLPDNGLITTAGGPGQPACLNNIVDCLVIYNTGTGATDFNAYNGNNIAAITAASNTLMTFDNTGLPGWSFPAASPSKITSGHGLSCCDAITLIHQQFTADAVTDKTDRGIDHKKPVAG